MCSRYLDKHLDLLFQEDRMSTEDQDEEHDFGDDGDDGLLDSPICSPEPEDRKICPSCHDRMKQPMILSCLHVFCLSCIEKQVRLF